MVQVKPQKIRGSVLRIPRSDVQMQEYIRLQRQNKELRALERE